VNSLLAPLLLAAAAFAAEPKVVPLYPGAAPGSETAAYEEQDTPGPAGNIARIANVTRPTLLAYIPGSNPTGAAVVVCPGGASASSPSITRAPT
jgi:hypothetical protein